MSNKTKDYKYWLERLFRGTPLNEFVNNFEPTPRDSILRNMHGTKITCPSGIDETKVPLVVKELFRLNNIPLDTLISGIMPCGKRVGKWLVNSHVPENVVSHALSAIKKSMEVEFTTDFKDIARMSLTKHFESCLAKSHKRQLLSYLKDPSVALIVIRDPKGDFSYRVIIRLAIAGEDQNCLVLNTTKAYGNGPHAADLATLIENTFGLPVFGSSKIVLSPYSLRTKMSDTQRRSKDFHFVYDDAHLQDKYIICHSIGPKSIR